MHLPPFVVYIAVVLAGLLAGFINTLAGSGSLISLPMLIFAGLPANVANGTNRIAILLQNIVAVRGYHGQSLLDWKRGLWLATPTTIGAIIGARIAVDLPEATMRRAIGAIMVMMLFVLLVNPKRWIVGKEGKTQSRPGLKEMAVFVLIGVYGGFIQAGVGIFTLAGLVLGAGYDIVRANAIKVLLVLIFTVPALAVFALHHQVNVGWGLLLAVGNMTGAWLGTRFAARPGAAVWVHRLLVIVVIYSALRLLFV